MRTEELIYAGLLGLVVLSCSQEVAAPPRPASVSASAVWRGGQDGGAWIDCRWQAKEPYASYACETYADRGSAWARGNFVLADRVEVAEGVTIRPVPSMLEVDSSELVGYDGVVIHLAGPRVLVPHGEIDYPFGDGHGKRAVYELGRQVTPDRQY